ncbi:MAG: hypothetical protein LBT32_02200 [Peptococcaceae bacterium]|nr:hypothetical protein [Peptococcaceae bacterium]
MIRRRRRPNGITKADTAAQKAGNLIAQDFSVGSPNANWLTDITEVPCLDGKIVGFHMDDSTARSRA